MSPLLPPGLRSLRRHLRRVIAGPDKPFANTARTREHLIAVGVGMGAAPVRALLEEADFLPGCATVILRGSSAADLPQAKEIRQICRKKGAQFHLLLGHHGPEAAAWVPREYADYGYGLAHLAPALRQADLFVCGPQPVVDRVLAEARSIGVDEDQIHTQRSES